MSVYPGFSGQKFINSIIPKIKEASDFIKSEHLKTRIEVDGGINDITGKQCVEMVLISLYQHPTFLTMMYIRAFKH